VSNQKPNIFISVPSGWKAKIVRHCKPNKILPWILEAIKEKAEREGLNLNEE